MTDDSRFRAPRAHGSTQPSGGRVRRTEDPLAELARLIGQEDPFADFAAHRPADARAAATGAQRRPLARDVRTPDPRALERRRPVAPARPSEVFEDLEGGHGQDEHVRNEGRGAGAGAYAYGGSRVPRADDIPAVSPKAFREDRPAVRAPARGGQERRAPAFDEHDDEIGIDQPRQARDSRAARRAPVRQYDDEGYDEFAAADYDPDYDDDAYLPAHGDEFYEEAPRRRLKGWMLAGIAAAAVVIVGVSSLFAYRAIFGVDEVGSPARIISADSGPTKMVPDSEAKAGDGKLIQDRVGAPPSRSAERIVPREENPIDQSRIPQSGSADRIPAGTVTAAPQFSAAPSQSAPAPIVAPASVSTEPRRVRTVTVRADGSVVPNPANSAATANGGRAGQGTQTSSPLALQGQGVAVPPARPAGTASSAPLQGDNPWSNLSSGQISAPTTQQAALPPPPPPQSAPTPAIAVQSAPPAGSYVVQVAAQKSEGEAQASWQTLQQRYSNVLGGQQAQIRRVDLGERGVYYRAQVGPFTTRAQASEVCQSLKAAGGDCVIQRN
jgi:hypothetical protein